MFGKRGKYEAVPTEAAVKYQKKSAKSNLLSAYFTSLLCLILCATMFLSTSMAWFTSEVNNSGNQIYVGTLGVKLFADGKEIKDGSDPILNNVKLSPDTHHIVELKVENSGNLPFNYRLTMTANYAEELADPATIADAKKALEAAKWIHVWVKNGDNWTEIGLLSDVLAGKVVLSGKMDDVATADESATTSTAHTYTVALHMDANAPSEIMGAKLTDISVKLIAAQQVAGLTVVADAEELSKAMAQGGNVLLLNDIEADADSTITVANGTTTNLYMNGHTIAGVSDQIGANRNLIDVRGVLNVYDGTITVKHTGDNMAWSNSTNVINITAGGVVNLKNTTIMNLGGSDMAFGVHMNNWGEVTLNVDNSKIVSTYGAIRVFNSGNDMNNVTVTNSTLIGKLAFWVHNYTAADFGADYDADKVNARLNFNILIDEPVALTTEVGGESNLNAEANNVVSGRILYGFTDGVDYYKDGKIPNVASNAQQLKTALASGGYVALAEDIILLGESFDIPAGVEVTLDLAGHDLSGKYTGTDHYAMFSIPSGAALTIEGEGEVVANTEFSDNNRSGAIFQNAGKLTINGGTYVVDDNTTGKTWIIATIIDNRTRSASDEAVVTINGGDFYVSGKAKNLFRNYPQQGGSAKMIFNDGVFHSKAGEITYIWNQEASTYPGELYFNGGTYEPGVVYEDYNGQEDIYIAPGVVIAACPDNN